MIADQPRFELAIQKFDLENSQDPNHETFQGKEYPKELLYARRMTEWLNKLSSEASESLQLAARSQHICRWTIPRGEYSKDRVGYLKWRNDLKRFHAQKAGDILKDCGYDDTTIDRVQSLLSKEKMRIDPESQLLEDVVCLVFMESYFNDFSHQHDEDKVVNIIRKTWKKMSNKGHVEALKIQLPPDAQRIIDLALAD